MKEQTQPRPVGIVDYEIPPSSGELKDGCWVQFRILTLVWNKGSSTVKEGLQCRVLDPAKDAQPSSIAQFITDNYRHIPTRKRGAPTPWDINTDDLDHDGRYPNPPRLMVIQLNNKLDWHFTEGGPGIRSKADVNGQDCSLYFVDANGKAHLATKAGAPPDCRTIYWSILSREKLTERGFNFYVTLNDKVSGKSMPTIFDPNVPDNGGASIP